MARLKLHPRWFAYATVLVAFVLRAYRLADKNIWWDEGWSVWLSQKDLAWIALRTAADEHPPLHYWLLHFWNGLAGTSAFAGRFVSLAFGVLTVALLYRIGKRVGGAWLGVLAALLLAIARFHIWWSQDIKNYTPSIFFAFAAVWFMLDVIPALAGGARVASDREAVKQSPFRHWGIASSPSSRLAMTIIGYALCAALALWTHYLAALVLIALNIYALLVLCRLSFVNHRWLIGSLRNWFIANLIAAALFAPWLYLYLQNAASWSAAPPFDFTIFLKLVATVLPLGVTTNIDAYAALTIVFSALAAMGIFANSKLKILSSKSDPAHFELRILNYAWLFALIVVFPPLLVYALSLTPVSFFAPKIQARYLLVLSPAYVLLLAFGVKFLSRLARAFAVIAILVVIGASALVLNDYYAARRLTDDYATLANTINAFARQGDLVLLDTDQEWPTVLYYLRAPLDWLGVPNGKLMTTGDADTLVQRALNRNLAVWLVTNSDALATDPQKMIETQLARKLSKQYERAVGDKRLALYASDSRDWINVAPENFAPQYLRVESINHTLQLLGFDLPTREVNAGDTLRLVTYWRATDPAMTNVRLTGFITTTLQMPRGNILRYENDFVIPPDARGDFSLVVGNVELARINIAPRAELAPVHDMAHPTDFRLGEALHLAGYDLPQTKFRAGDTVPLILYWRADHPVEKNYTAFVHLVGAQFNPRQNNPLWGQMDRAPTPPTSAWLPRDLVPDVYSITLDATAPPGKYQIEIGMYDPATGTRLPTDQGDRVIIAEIEVR